MLFPFLLGRSATAGRSSTRYSDGDVAFDLQGPKAVRVARESDNPLQVDGVHVRRMLMVSRSGPCWCGGCWIIPGTRLSATRREGALDVVDVTLKEGDKLTAAFAAAGRPACDSAGPLGIPTWGR